MTGIVFACVAPHGSEIVEDLAGSTPELMASTRASLQALGKAARAASLDAMIVLTPHGTRVEGQFALADSERMAGEVESHGVTLTMERRVDRTLARSVAQAAEADGLRVASLNFATSEGPFSNLPLDWGVIIPLHFMPDVPVVVINPPRGTDLAPHERFGAALARAARESGKRVGLIASCDWSHTHDASGPYGFHEAAARLDGAVVDAMKRGDLEALATFDATFVEDAKPDGLWQTLVLAGAIPREARHVDVLSYEAPTYFGLLCARVTSTA
ncbi:extradiol ring-cleavage dioxygenase [Deinococcus yavapaiensis]|uniref:Aromatic ring-opening dioxygenase LigB subunit n=1 Tax=Deinococcus yavapaiensis KR-236 TaxID=694435 RepID=A0A318S6C6_9DEIO|nr:extradiol ring-cleavage dioxygenase [Deinococcus yavapaiensis]PYE49940.1 aromatic ring-opening dioxygenase LigB subunit [Deinococcus yavapaiensis KR-236]